MIAKSESVKSRYLEEIEQLRAGDVLVLSSRLVCRLFETCFSFQLFDKYNTFYDDEGSRITEEQAQDHFVRGLGELSSLLEERQVNIVVVQPLPEIRIDPELCQLQWFRPIRSARCHVPADALEARRVMAERLTEFVSSRSAKNVHLFDGFDVICRDEACGRVYEEPRLMQDPTHISPTAARELAAPFREFLSESKLLEPS